jgi:hypothetical protein
MQNLLEKAHLVKSIVEWRKANQRENILGPITKKEILDAIVRVLPNDIISQEDSEILMPLSAYGQIFLIALQGAQNSSISEIASICARDLMIHHQNPTEAVRKLTKDLKTLIPRILEEWDDSVVQDDATKALKQALSNE